MQTQSDGLRLRHSTRSDGLTKESQCLPTRSDGLSQSTTQSDGLRHSTRSDGLTKESQCLPTQSDGLSQSTIRRPTQPSLMD